MQLFSSCVYRGFASWFLDILLAAVSVMTLVGGNASAASKLRERDLGASTLAPLSPATFQAPSKNNTKSSDSDALAPGTPVFSPVQSLQDTGHSNDGAQNPEGGLKKVGSSINRGMKRASLALQRFFDGKAVASSASSHESSPSTDPIQPQVRSELDAVGN